MVRVVSGVRRRGNLAWGGAGVLVGLFAAALVGGVSSEPAGTEPILDQAAHIVLMAGGGLALALLTLSYVRHWRARARTKAALQRSEGYLDQVVRNVADGLITIDERGSLLSFNPAAETIFGYPADEVIGRNVSMLMPEPDRGRHDKYIESYRGSGVGKILGVGPRELTGMRKGGTTFPMELAVSEMHTGKRRLFIGMVRDATRRKETEEALRDNEASLRSILAYTPTGIVLKDVEGRYIVVNRAFERLHGVTAGNMIGRQATDVFPAEIAGAIAADDEKVLRTGAIIERQREVETPEGLRVVMEQRFPIRPSEGVEDAMLAIGVIATDITKLKRAGNELREAMVVAEAANRAKAEFLTTMSHELRTPLNAIIGYSELLQKEMFGPLGSEKYGDYVADIHSCGKHLLQLITDILEYARVEDGKLEIEDGEIDLGAVIAAALDRIRGEIEGRGLETGLDLEPGLPWLRGDEHKVRQILSHLLSNAVKFTSPPGAIRVGAARLENGRLAVTVSDTGIGIAAEDISSALMPFGQVDSRLERKFDGAGLGLTLAKTLTELHGGRLVVDSEPDRGTSVTVEFPSDRTLEDRRAAE